MSRMGWVGLLAAALSLGACADEGVGAQSADVKDTWAHPTAHGELRFNVPNDATFTETQRFHQWTFTLGAQAHLRFETEMVTPNTDTVMYLYRKGADGRWGSYKAKNDDHGDKLTSLIEKDLLAGEYQIKVKAKKLAIAGGFLLHGDCTGDGCPEVDRCAEPDALPAVTGFSASCGERFDRVVSSYVDHFTQEDEIAYSRRCLAGEHVARAIDWFKEYYTPHGDWDAFSGEEDGDPMMLYELRDHDEGVTISVDWAGGDETKLHFVIDREGALISIYSGRFQPHPELVLCAAGRGDARGALVHGRGALLPHPSRRRAHRRRRERQRRRGARRAAGAGGISHRHVHGGRRARAERRDRLPL